MRYVGKSFDKIDAQGILSGKPSYTEDFIPSNALYIKVIRSPHPFARVLDVDGTKAMKVPGVEAVFSYKDTPKKRFTMAGQSYPEPSAYDKYILEDIVRYVGDEVALVVATDRRTAERAALLVDIKYEVLPPVLDMHQAIDHPSVVHPEDDLHFNFPVGGDVKRNIACSYMNVKGDIEGELAKCDYVVEGHYFDQATQQTAMETFRSYCYIDTMGRLVCTSSTQIVFHLRRHIAEALGISPTKVRVKKPRIGGGFGSKQTACCEMMNAFVTWKLKKPSYIIYDRYSAAGCSTTRHARSWDIRIGATKDGIIKVVDMTGITDAGAYGTHAFTTTTAGEHKSVVLYNKAIATRYGSTMVYTNHEPGGAYRGYGATEALWPLECAVTKLAKKMGMDEMELRKKNLISAGERHIIYDEDEIMESGLFQEALQKVKDMSGWDKRPHGWRIDNRYRGGLGVSCALQGSGIAKIDTASVEIRLQENGTFTLYTGSSDMGTGANTILCQMASEVLGCPLENMGIIESDTDMVPFDPGSYASSTTYVTGTAAKMAAEELYEKIINRFAKEFNVTADEVEFDGENGLTKDGKHVLPLKTLATRLMARPDTEQMIGFASWGSESSPPPFMISVAEVKVDTYTGKVIPMNFYSVVDCGTVVNPKLARVQAEGGIVQGIGMALYEEVRYTKRGSQETNNLMTYKIPTRLDIGNLHVEFVESYEPSGAYGVKSIGEVVINTSCPAIQGAILNATGADVTDLPMIPERVYNAMNTK